MDKPTYHFTPIARRKFAVQIVRGGEATTIGTVRDFYITHMKRRGWEATGLDGHRGVHEHRWQAALALSWDGKGYPFPFVSSRRHEVESDG